MIDLMQLDTVLQGGVDVDGNGTADLSTSRIYYSGQSFGGIYGVELLGLEPTIHAGVPNVAGRADRRDRPARAELPRPRRALAARARPALYNATPVRRSDFNENMPFTGQPLVVDTVNGA